MKIKDQSSTEVLKNLISMYGNCCTSFGNNVNDLDIPSDVAKPLAIALGAKNFLTEENILRIREDKEFWKVVIIALLFSRGNEFLEMRRILKRFINILEIYKDGFKLIIKMSNGSVEIKKNTICETIDVLNVTLETENENIEITLIKEQEDFDTFELDYILKGVLSRHITKYKLIRMVETRKQLILVLKVLNNE